MKTPQDLDTFTRAYIECALWSSSDTRPGEPEGIEPRPLDEDYGISDIAPETLEEMIADCAKFQAENGEVIDCAPVSNERSSAGHDFWLTRNLHGVGFWDGDWTWAGKQLTEASHAFGEYTLYIGDNGLIYA